ncbi:hypothetical protein [Alcaligenes faecalis]|uniref:hypothetical protein n=1 Tax=Alcaligenes faecalis TaxID=511 RepID=UPI0005A8EF66|nr:hypothetical protein [Alcaligenes faecalis]ATH99158.1 hypothetical protein CPY64_05160 [Alcaligenes faecalis]AYZ91945.1 hypothetical protein EGY22_10930 [Alcaligenes faecalis]MCX5595593.1 hypothetical protein [Alcaligenes faecalis]QQC32249.1 hypothetical protein I6H81_16720 [Alcaligenes faecalis]CAJ0900463.1 40S ribosomal protein S19 [Alcaligenes faecalis subsp. faecalis]
MKPRTVKPKRTQLDFWPELLNKGMVHYARLTGSGSTLHMAAARSEPLSPRACPQLREDSRGATAGSGTPPSKTGRNGEAAGMEVKQ